MIVKPLILSLLVTSGMLCADAVAVSVVRTPAIDSLQRYHDEVHTREVTYVFIPPFTEYVVPIKLPFTPDPEAFKTVLFPRSCVEIIMR